MTHAASTTIGRGGLSMAERVIRVVLGGGAVLAGVLVWTTGSGILLLVGLGVALLGLDFVVTGIRGYCPLYARLGIGQPWPRRVGTSAGRVGATRPDGSRVIDRREASWLLTRSLSGRDLPAVGHDRRGRAGRPADRTVAVDWGQRPGPAPLRYVRKETAAPIKNAYTFRAEAR